MSESTELKTDSNNKGPDVEKPAFNWGVFLISGGVLFAFVIAALIDLDTVKTGVDSAFGFSTDYFGAFWQYLLLANFFVAIALAMSRLGSRRLGGDRPEMSTFRWIAILMCTVLAAGGVFFCFAEPMHALQQATRQLLQAREQKRVRQSRRHLPRAFNIGLSCRGLFAGLWVRLSSCLRITIAGCRCDRDHFSSHLFAKNTSTRLSGQLSMPFASSPSLPARSDRLVFSVSSSATRWHNSQSYRTVTPLNS